jgi:hypothetical protein
MNARDLASVAFLVFGIHLLITLPTSLASAIWLLQVSASDPAYIEVTSGVRIALGLLFFITLVGGLSLIWWRNALARAAFPGASRQQDAPTIPSPADITATLLAVAGVWLSITAVRDAAPSLTEGLMRSWNPVYGSTDTDPLFVWPQRAALIFQFAAGVILFFGSHGLTRIWHWARSTPRTESAV